MVSEFGWHPLYLKQRNGIVAITDEEYICASLSRNGISAIAAGTRNQSYDLEVTSGLVPGRYEVKRLSLRPGGHSVDRRFKAGRRGETIYGRRDAEIKCFATALEDFLDDCLWSMPAVEETHAFIDNALQRRHGKKFHDRLVRLANKGLAIPGLMFSALRVIKGGVRPQDIQAGFAGLSGIFIIAGPIYTLVKPSEYMGFIGFDSASAEGPKLSFQGIVPLDTK